MASSLKIAERIAGEQKNRENAISQKSELTASRSEALAAGADDVVIDRIENDIKKAERQLARSTERLQLLEHELAKARDQEDSARLDGMATRAERARKLGEQLIHGRYRKAATEIAEILETLRAVDELIITTNIELHRAGRKAVLSPNVSRGRETRREMRKVKRSFNPGNINHPNAQYIAINANGKYFDTRTNEQIGPQSFEYDEERLMPGYCPDELYKKVVLPTTEVDGEAIWPVAESAERTEEIIKALADGDGLVGKLKSLTSGKAA